jgi:hypothetical protein
MAEWVRGVLFLVLTLGIPGIVLFLAWATPSTDAPDDSDGQRAAERWAIALAVPAALLVLGSELLARVSLLTAATTWIYAAAVSGGAVALAVYRGQIVRARITSVRLSPLLANAGAPLLVLAATAPQVWMVNERSDSLQSPTSWYYWHQSVSVAASQAVPDVAREWGITVPFFDYHLGFNTVGAATALAVGDLSSMVGVQLLRILAVLGAAFGVWILSRVWGAPRYAAAAGAIATPAIAILAVKLASYRPEAAGYMLLLLTPALLKRWFQHGGRLLLAATVLSFLGVAQTHTPAATVTLALCAATALVYFRPSLRWLGAAAGIGVLLVGTWFVTDLVTGHRGPFAEGFAEPPELTASGKDPTYEFRQLALGYSPPDAMLGVHHTRVRTMISDSFSEGFLGVEPPVTPAFFVLAGVVAVAAALLRRWNVVRMFVLVLVFVALLLAVALAGTLQWETFVPRRSGFTRLVELWWLAPLAFLPLAATLVDRRWFRVTATVLLLAAAGWLWWQAEYPTRRLVNNQPRRDTLEQVRRLRLEPGSLVLTNTFTQDFIKNNTDAVGLLDGRAPYLERDRLDRSNRIMRRASWFFADPGGHPFPFSRYGIDYVLVGTEPYALGNIAVYPPETGLPQEVAGLELVERTRGFQLYRVLEQ